MTLLKVDVVVQHPETLAPAVLAAGTELPDWAAGQVTNPGVLDRGQSPAAVEPPATPAPKPDADPDTDGDPGQDRPPRRGRAAKTST